MIDPSTLSDEQLAAIAGQTTSPPATGTSPPASSPASGTDANPIQLGPNDPGPARGVAYVTPGGVLWSQAGQPSVAHKSDVELQQMVGQGDPLSDMAHSIAPGLEKGVAGLVGLPGDALNLWHNATEGAGQFAADILTNREDKPQYGQVAQNLHIPTGRDVNQAAQGWLGPYYQPQTWQGRAVETVGEMAPNALLPGSLATRAARALVPAAASDAAGEGARAFMPGDAGAEQLARGIGGFVGGVGQAGAEGIVNAPQASLSRALNGADPQTLDALQRLLSTSKALPGGGVTLTPAEAGAQVGIPQLAKIQHFVENTPQGGAALGPFFAQRPAQVASTTGALADALDGGVSSNPGMLGTDAQSAAQGVQIGANAARASAAKAAGYTAAGPEGVDGKSLADLLERIDSQIAGDKTGLLGSRVAAFRGDLTDPEGLAYTDIDSLSRVRNHWRDQIDIPPVGANPLTKEQAGAIGSHLGDLESLLKSNANYAAGDASFADTSRNLVDPINAGPIGTIAETADVPTQTAALFQPRNAGGAAEAGEALSHLWGQNPELPGQLTAQYLRNSADSALRNLQGGANEWGGARLGVKLAGSPEARSAFLGGTSAAGGDATQMADYLDALGATGKRLPVGSRTYFNEQMAHELGIPQGGFSSWSDPLTYGHMINNAVGGALYRHRIGTLADFLTSGDAGAQRQFLDQAQSMRGGANYGLANALISARAGADAP